jgi:hypothetical protein
LAQLYPIRYTDQGAKIPFPGMLLYAPGMPAVILTNICTPLGQVNGAAGDAVGVVVDPAGMFGFPRAWTDDLAIKNQPSSMR